MAIDLVHDTQEVFRILLNCMSRPGTIENIEEIGRPIGQHQFCDHSIFVSAITLLDGETSFHVVGEQADNVGEFLSSFTYAKIAELQQADYIFIMKDAKKQQIKNVFKEARKGTLRNPQQSTTILIETNQLSTGNQLQLEGPGIERTKNVEIEGSKFWITERAEAVKEYPLGVDLILIDSTSNIMCLPRTTLIYEREVS